MEHELRLATHQQRAGGQDDGSLNKLPQIILFAIEGWGVGAPLFLVLGGEQPEPWLTIQWQTET